MLKRKQCTYGKNLQIVGCLFVHGKKGGLRIGNNCTIFSKGTVNPTSGFSSTHIRAEGAGKVVLGNHVGISHANITSFCKVEIGDDVLIGSGVKIWDTDFHAIGYNERIHDRPANAAPIIIKKGAFIGACSIVLKGVTIGEYAVVGAGSVVTKDIPANEIWAGNPAHFVKAIENEPKIAINE